MFDKNFMCVNPCNFEIGDKFAEAVDNFPRRRIIVGPGDKSVWNTGGDAGNPVDFDHHVLSQLRPAITRCEHLLCINPVARYRTFPKRDDWHFNKNAETEKARCYDRTLDEGMVLLLEDPRRNGFVP